jgi:hypothetical protein
MPTHVYTVGRRIIYTVQLSTPWGSIGSREMRGSVTELLTEGKLTIDLDGNTPPFQVPANDAFLRPA